MFIKPQKTLNKFIILLLLLSVLFGLTACAIKNDYKNVHNILIEKLNLQNGGTSAAIMQDGKINYLECFRISNGETKELINENTRFNIASISKIFATTAAMILVDESKLDLDRPIFEYLPEFSMTDKNYKKITTRMLFSYSSGISGTFLDGYEGDRYDQDYTKKFLEFMKTQSLKFAPGESSFYCNNSITPIEILVEKISGQRYMNFLVEKIFTPLDLKNTGVSLGEYATSGQTNISYGFQDGKNIPPLAISSYAAGGLSSTASDLCKFGDIFCENPKIRILSENSVEEIKKIHSSEIPDKTPKQVYCLGFSNLIDDKYKDIFVLSKSGVSDNHQAMLFVLPDKNTVIALLVADKDYDSWFSKNSDLFLNVLDEVIGAVN